MYIIEATGKRGGTVYLADKEIVPDMWWTSQISQAKKIESEDVAIQICSRYVYGNPRIRELDEMDMVLSFVEDLRREKWQD